MSAPIAEVENEPDRLVRWGLLVVGLACIVASGDVLVYVAHRAGWDGWRAYMLPVLIDLPGFLGGRIWLRRARTSADTRRYARGLTLAALSVSILGNAIGHLVKSNHLTPGVALVILTGIVAPVVLWAVLHLDALLTPTVAVPVRDAAPVPAEKPESKPKTEKKTAPPKAPVPKPSPDEPVNDVEMQAARHADRDYRADNGGKPITRDALKSALAPCGTTKATALLAALKREREAA